MTQVKKITVTLPEGLVLGLNDFSKELGRSKSGLIKEAIEYYFDILDLKIAEHRAATKGKTYTLDEVKAMINE